jgi:5,10-methylenetetrahydromethanopterin reductase
MRITAEDGDGWITFMGTVERAVQQAAALDEACTAAGRDPASLYRTVFALGCVLAEGEPADSPRAIAQAGPSAAVGWHGLVERTRASGEPVREPYASVYNSYGPPDARYLSLHRGHLLFVRDDERQFVTADAIRAGTLTGTASEIGDRLPALEAAGYNQLTIQLVYGHEDAVEDWARVLLG